MRGTDAFRRKLRRRLLGIAQARRCACANQPSGADLKAIAHCERLAASAEAVSPRLCAAVGDALSEPAAARRFAAIWAELPEALGTTVWPRDAADLTAALVQQAAREATPSRRVRSARAVSAGTQTRVRAGKAPSLATAVASDFTGGLAVVAPMLAVWQVAAGLRQWDQAGFAASHPAILARVDALSSAATKRVGIPLHRAAVTFTPAPGAASCQVKVGLDGTAAVGSMISVVPRSSVCEAPLVTASIGDPAASFMMAAVFAVAGVGSLKAWSWLGCGVRRGTPPARSARTMRLSL